MLMPGSATLSSQGERSLNDLPLFQAFKKRFVRGAGHTSRCRVESTELRPS